MASYNELNALIDAYINRNGVQAITGQILNGVLKAMVEQIGRGYALMGIASPNGDPGTPDAPESFFASEPGTYTNFGGQTVAPGEFALLYYIPSEGWFKETIYEGFQTVQASIDGNVGTPSVGVSYANGVLSFDFHNMKGNPGQNGQDGQDGDPAGFGTIGADITGGVGTPGVSVESSGPATAKNLQFHFTNLKGETGVTSVVATVDNTTGNPTCTASLSGGVLTLAFTGLKGAQGNPGSSVDYPFTLVNNLTTDDPDQALTAAMGVQLESEISQLGQRIDELGVEINGGAGLNPANLLTDPTFADGLWELQNGTVTISDVQGSLSKRATVERINTGASAYYFLRLPVSLFEDGKTYRISVISSNNSQKLATRNDNGSGFVGYILADVSMTCADIGGGKYLCTYDWTVAASSFGTYDYVQIAFKFYDGYWFEEPFAGLASGNTDYEVTSTRIVLKKTDVVDNLLSAATDVPLSARQGKVLDEKMDNLPFLSYTEVEPTNKCPGDFYDNKYYGSSSGAIQDANNYACAKPFLLPAGNYLYIINKQMFGSGAGYAYIFADPDDTVAASSVPGTLLEERTSGGYTMGIYAVTIPTDSYVGFNVGVIQDEAGFMVVEGTTIADWPSSYEPYFEPYKKLPDDVKITDTNPLLGKKLAVEGDSICQGAGMNGGYAKIIGENNEMSVANNGVSGGTITYGTKYSNNTDRHWICTGIALMPQDYDYYIFEGGVNDCANQVTIGDLVNGYPVEGSGDTLNKETLIGAMEYACRSLVTTFPGKKCGFIFVHGIFGNDSQLRVYWAEAKEKMIRALKKWGVPYIDLESLVPPLNCIQSLKSVYTANGDGWHPNELGYNTFYVEKITEWMKTL